LVELSDYSKIPSVFVFVSYISRLEPTTRNTVSPV